MNKQKQLCMSELVILSAFPRSGLRLVKVAAEVLCGVEAKPFDETAQAGVLYTQEVWPKVLVKNRKSKVVSVARNFSDVVVSFILDRSKQPGFVKDFAERHGLVGEAELLNVFIEANDKWLDNTYFSWLRFNRPLISANHARVNFDKAITNRRRMLEGLCQFVGGLESRLDLALTATEFTKAKSECPTFRSGFVGGFRTVLENPAIAKLERLQRHERR